MHERDKPWLGISLRLLSGVLAAGMFISVKAVSDDVPLGEIVFFRAFFALIPLAIFLWLRSEFPGGLATKRPFDHLMRASFGALALFAALAALARLNLAEAILLAQLSPIFMAVGAVVILKERMTIWRVVGVVLGLVGVVVLVWPDLWAAAPKAASASHSRVIGYAIGVTGAFLSALALLLVRSLNRTESPGAIAIYFVLASMIGGLMTVPAGWVMPNGTELLLLISCGIFGGCMHIAMTMSFRYAEASRLAPFEYVALVWPVIADLVVFNQTLSSAFLLAAPILLSGAALAAMEGRKSRMSDAREDSINRPH